MKTGREGFNNTTGCGVGAIGTERQAGWMRIDWEQVGAGGFGRGSRAKETIRCKKNKKRRREE